jgi:hypothetical protein
MNLGFYIILAAQFFGYVQTAMQSLTCYARTFAERT